MTSHGQAVNGHPSQTLENGTFRAKERIAIVGSGNWFVPFFAVQGTHLAYF
jgi:hypothetical protein